MQMDAFVPLLFFGIAFLYAVVGHGGASGYIALMVLLGLDPTIIRPSALILNIAVSGLATFQYYSGGHFKKQLLIPFVAASVPFAFFGAGIHLSSTVFKALLGICLLIAIGRILFQQHFPAPSDRKLPLPLSLLVGASIGMLSGMLGIGGGILLSPFLLIGRWATIKEAAAVAAPFIFLNSMAALIALHTNPLSHSPATLISWMSPVIAGGMLGAYGGSHRFNVRWLSYFLAVVLVIAAAKLIFP